MVTNILITCTIKEPQPPLKWSGIRDASEHAGSIALQVRYNGMGPHDVGYTLGEDCLYLNVYTNTIARKKPVIFSIHGGSFIEGNANHILYGEDYLVSKDIVLVCPNFRLGPMGI